MLDYIRIACAVPAVRVGDTKKNAADICEFLKKADVQKVDLLVFPEMALTGYTCQDLFFQDALHRGVKEGLREVLDASAACPEVTAVVGLPLRVGPRMYNCAAVISGGEVRGIVPKSSIPNYNEFYEKRWFASGDDLNQDSFDIGSLLGGYPKLVPIGQNLLFRIGEGTLVGVEICEDLWTPLPPSHLLALSGAEVIVNLSASNETIGKRVYRRELVTHQSASLNCIYAYCSAGSTESTQDLIFSGQSLIAENGKLLAETKEAIATDYLLVQDCDLGKVRADRRRNRSYADTAARYAADARMIPVRDGLLRSDGKLYPLEKLPFVPSQRQNRIQRCMEIFQMQVAGLKQRLAVIGNPSAVIGISGGLDSTLALLVAVEAMRQLIGHAHVITPNLTEAAFLLDEPYRPDISPDGLKEQLQRLAAMGPDRVVITSAPAARPDHCAAVAYDRGQGRFWKMESPYIPAFYPGTGDTFSSVLVGAFLQGDSLPVALERAVRFVTLGIRVTYGYDTRHSDGVLLERTLPALQDRCAIGEYEAF